MMSLARVLREVQYSKLYCSWDPFTDSSCAESWENSPGQLQSFFCLEIHISLGRCIHVTDVNQDWKCLNVFSVCLFVSLYFMMWTIFFLPELNSFRMNGAVTGLAVSFLPQCLFKLTSPVLFKLKVGKCSC